MASHATTLQIGTVILTNNAAKLMQYMFSHVTAGTESQSLHNSGALLGKTMHVQQLTCSAARHHYRTRGIHEAQQATNMQMVQHGLVSKGNRIAEELLIVVCAVISNSNTAAQRSSVPAATAAASHPSLLLPG